MGLCAGGGWRRHQAMRRKCREAKQSVKQEHDPRAPVSTNSHDGEGGPQDRMYGSQVIPPNRSTKHLRARFARTRGPDVGEPK